MQGGTNDKMKHFIPIVASLALILIGGLALSRRHHPRQGPPTGPTAVPPPSTSVQMVDPKTLLFSFPTLCDTLPPTGSHVADLPVGVFELHEDDWRQIEFVAESDRPVVERELSELVQFKAVNRVGSGWKNVYVRKSRPAAVGASQISLKQVLRLMGKDVKSLPLLLRTLGTHAEVQGGFAVAMPNGAMLYGYADADRVISLNIHFSGPQVPSDGLRVTLSNICLKFHLILVDWYRAAIVLPS